MNVMFFEYILCENLNLNDVNSNNWSSTVEMLGQFFFLIIIFIIILILAFYSTKFIANAKIKSTKNNNMRIVESMGIGFQHTIQLLKVGNKYLVISVSKDKVEFIAEIDEKSIDINEDVRVENKEFETYFKEIIQNLKKKK